MSAQITSQNGNQAQNELQQHIHTNSIEEHSSSFETDDFHRISDNLAIDQLDPEKGVSRAQKLRKLSAVSDYQEKSYTNADVFVRQAEAISQDILSQNQTKALVFTNLFCVTMVVFATGLQAVTIAASSISIFEILFIRNLIGLPIQFMISTIQRQKLLSEETLINIKPILGRCLMPTIGISAQFVALQYLSVSVVTVIYQTFPFWAALFAYLLLNERVTKIEILAMAICFGAVVGMMVTTDSSGSSVDSDGASTSSQSSALIGFGCALMYSLAMAMNGTLARKASSVHFSVQLFFMCLVGAIIASIGLVFVYFCSNQKIFAQEPIIYCYLVLLCLVELCSGICLTNAFKYGETSYVSLVGNAVIVYGFFADIMIFNTQISASQGLGALVIVLTLVIVGSLKVQKKL